MSSKVLPLAIASGASLAALGGVAAAFQDRTLQTGAGLQAGYTKICAYRNGPRAGQTVDYGGTAGAVPVQIGKRCSDLQGSSGVAVAATTTAQPAAPDQRQQGQGRFYRGPDTPSGWNAASNALQYGFTLSCRFINGPRAGTSADFSRTLGAQPVAVGNPCSDAGSSGVGVAPSSADIPQF
jgi:hypothetical protein